MDDLKKLMQSPEFKEHYKRLFDPLDDIVKNLEAIAVELYFTRKIIEAFLNESNARTADQSPSTEAQPSKD